MRNQEWAWTAEGGFAADDRGSDRGGNGRRERRIGDAAAQPEVATADIVARYVDRDWYLARNTDVATAGLDPVLHYLTHGAEERREPNAWFDAAWYAAMHPGVPPAGTGPLVHYAMHGARALLRPHPRFDAAWYAAGHPEAREDPLWFHIRQGAERGWATEPELDISALLPSRLPAPTVPDITVDVIIPVYEGLDDTIRCLESVLSDHDRMSGRVIVIDDCSPNRALSDWLTSLADEGRIELLRNPRNQGFVASVNRGMTMADRNDVVLLNSDTEVPSGWLRRLAAHAHAVPRRASVSPFSNNATICG